MSYMPLTKLYFVNMEMDQYHVKIWHDLAAVLSHVLGLWIM